VRILYLGIAESEHLRRWVGAAAARGHEAHLASFEPAPVEGATLHPLIRHAGKARRYARALGDIRRLISRLAPDLVHAHFLTGYGYLAPWLGFHPWALTLWGTDILQNPQRSRADRWLSRAALRSADLVIADSRDALRAAQRLGARPDRSLAIPWGVEVDRFRPPATHDERRQLLRALELPDSALVVLSARSLTEPFYRVEDVVRGTLQAMQSSDDLFLVVAGGGELLEPLRAAVRDHPGAARIRWLGQVERRRMVSLMALADIYVSVPTHDATSVALLEAMASGCALVASDLPSNREWVVPLPGSDATGTLVPARAPEAVAAAITAYAQDRFTRERVARAARARVVRHGEFERCQGRVDRALRGVVQSL